jgi:hypothetical protein
LQFQVCNATTDAGVAAVVLCLREYPDERDLSKYQLSIHCGGCMIDPQKMRARISDMEEAGIPVTNYGLFLSYVHSPHALARALEPWGVTLPL